MSLGLADPRGSPSHVGGPASFLTPQVRQFRPPALPIVTKTLLDEKAALSVLCVFVMLQTSSCCAIANKPRFSGPL